MTAFLLVELPWKLTTQFLRFCDLARKHFPFNLVPLLCCSFMPVCSGQVKPLVCEDHIFGNASSIQMAETEIKLRSFITLIC